MNSLYLEEWDAFIRYHTVPGEGTPLVYLPGLCMPSVEQFLPVVTHPEMVGRHSLLIDFIGSGCSDHCEKFDYSIENHTRSIIAILDYEGTKGCTVIGHSMGGTVGIMVALLRPDLVSKLIVAEANISPGGGDATSRIADCSETEFLTETHQNMQEELRRAEIKGDQKAAFIYTSWSKADPTGLYKSSVALVELDTSFKEQFYQLSIPRTFIYGEKTLLKEHNKARPDAPDPKELEEFNIRIAIVPNAVHAMMFDNLQGFVEVLKHTV